MKKKKYFYSKTHLAKSFFKTVMVMNTRSNHTSFTLTQYFKSLPKKQKIKKKKIETRKNEK